MSPMPTRVAVILVGVLGVIGFAPRFAFASPPPPLLVLTGPGQSPATARARQILRDVGTRRGSVLLDLTTKPVAPAQARLLLSRGIDAYVNLNYGKAIKHLNAGIAEAERTGARGLTPSGLSDLFIYRGLAYTQQGNAAKAWEDFVRAATLAPTRTLDPVRFPPRAVESFTRAVKSVTATTPSALTIEANPGCKIWLNARSVADKQAQTLSRGEHYVRVDCTGFEAFATKLAVARAQQRLRPTMRRRAQPSAAQVVALARNRSAGMLLLASVDVSARAPATLRMRLIDVSSSKPVHTELAPLSGDDVSARVRAAVTRMIDRVVAPTPLPKPITLRVPVARPWYQQAWFWAVAGAAISAAVLTPILLNRDNSGSAFDLKPGGNLPW